MKKISLFLTAILLLGMFSALPASAALSPNASGFSEGGESLFINENAADILNNGGFDFGSVAEPQGWDVSCNYSIGGASQNYFESEAAKRVPESRNGAYALRLYSPNAVASQNRQAEVCVRQTVSVTPGVTYEFSVWVKTLTPETGYSYFHGMFANASGGTDNFSRMNLTFQNPSATTPITLPQGTWVKKGLRFTAPEGAVKLTVYLYMKGQGTILMDDAVILAPREAIPANATDVPKEPVLTEADVDLFGDIYALSPHLGTFERYSDNYLIGKSERPGGHHLQVSSLYNHTPEGTKSLHMKNGINPSMASDEPNLYFDPVYLMPGATYQISTWILAPEAGTRSDFSYWINLTFSDGTTDQKKTHFTVTNYGWWRQFCFNFTIPQDSASVRTNVELRHMNKYTGYYIDDVSLYMIEKPPYVKLRTDEMFYYTDFGKGVMSARVNDVYEGATFGGKVVYTFLGQDKETVLDTKIISINDKIADCEFTLDWLAEKGKEYFIRASVYDAAERLLQEEIHSVYRFDRPYYLGKDGVFRKNGKEYNLMYGSNVTNELLDADPRRGGIQIVKIIADDSGLSTIQKMDKAHEMGLLVLIGLYANGKMNSLEQMTKTVTNMKDHPALYGYQVQDEPYQKGNTEEALANAYVTVRNIDPYHVVNLVDSVEGGFDYLFRYADQVDIDSYGGRGADSGRAIYNTMQKAYEASKGRKPFTYMQQAFQYEKYLPTIPEIRNMTYQSFFAGAHGISYHSLGVDGSDGVTTPYMFLPDWEELCNTFAGYEQDTLLDCFVNKKYPQLDAYMDDNIMWRTFQGDGKIYLVIYNRQKKANSAATIPLKYADGTAWGNFVATRTAGGEAVSVFGNGTLNLTLGGIRVCQTGMTYTYYDGLASEIWEIAPDFSVIPNGSFEGTFTTYADAVRVDGVETPISTPVPASGWVAYKGGRPNTVDGSVSQASAETLGEKTILPVDGEKTLKIEKWPGTISGSRMGVLYPLNSTLTEGEKYKFEAYVNIPALSNGTVLCGLVQDLNRGTVEAVNNTGQKFTSSTDGWVKIENEFTYSASAQYVACDFIGLQAEGVAYFDGLKISPVTEPGVLVDETFEGEVNAEIYKTYPTRTAEVRTDPTDSENNVLYLGASDCAFSILPVDPSTSKVAPLSELFGIHEVCKVTYRLYVPSQAALGSDETLNVGVRITDTSNNMIRKFVSLSPSDLNKWHNMEFYMNGFTSLPASLYQEFGKAVTCMVDDLKVEKVKTEGFISAMNASQSGGISKPGLWMFGATGEHVESFSKTDVIRPVIGYVPFDVKDKALASAALYKVVDGVVSLVDVKMTTLGKTPLVSLTQGTANSSTIGIASEELAFDLAEYDLSEGAYSMHYFLWDKNGSIAITDKVTLYIN